MNKYKFSERVGITGEQEKKNLETKKTKKKPRKKQI